MRRVHNIITHTHTCMYGVRSRAKVSGFHGGKIIIIKNIYIYWCRKENTNNNNNNNNPFKENIMKLAITP